MNNQLTKKELQILRTLLHSQVLGLDHKEVDQDYLDSFNIESIDQVRNLYKKLK